MQKKFFSILYSALIILAVGIFLGFKSLAGGKLEMVLLDIGQGDAIFVRTPLSQKILIDGGPEANILMPLSKELRFFERNIDLLVITHPDLDHIAGLTEILRRYKVKNILMSGVQHETAWYQDILQKISEQNVPVYIAHKNLDFDFGAGVIFDVIWPREIVAGSRPKNANFPSIVVRVTYGVTSALLTGDFEKNGEEELLKTTQNVSSDILKLGHHGSQYSSSEDFLRTVQSKIVLVSAGKDNQFGHPHEEVIEKIKNQKIYSTINRGSVKLISNGKIWTPE